MFVEHPSGLWNACYVKLKDDTGYLQLGSMTTTQKNAINAQNGMMVYDETLGAIHSYVSGAWGVIGGGGDVSGPGSSTDNAIARFNGTGGKTLQDSVVTIADSTGNMAGVGSLTLGDVLTFSDGGTIDNSDASTLQITETTIDLVGATLVDALTLSDVLTFSDGATIDNTDASTLTITETNIDLVGALAADAVTLSDVLTFSDGGTIDNTDASTLTITETTIDLVGATLADALTLSDVLTFSDGGTIDNTDANTLTITETNITLTGVIDLNGATTADALTLSDVLTFSDGATIDNTDASTLTITETNIVLTADGISGSAIKDEDNMASNSATHLATQQSIKAYVDAASGIPGGSDTQIQYNDGGSFGGISTVTWNDTTLTVKNPFTVGQDDTGHDVIFYGATSGAFAMWDESEDAFLLRGGAASPGTLVLQTAETTIVDGDKLGQIDFQAPLEASGTDAIVVAASIWAEADDTFDTDNNSAELVFATANSGAVAEAMRIDHDGNVGIGTTSPDGELDVRGKVWIQESVAASSTGFFVKELSGATKQWNVEVIGLSVAGREGNFEITEAGTANWVTIQPGGNFIYNESGADADFRVESDGNANMLFVDGGNDAVVIGGNNGALISSSDALLVHGTIRGYSTSNTTFACYGNAGNVNPAFNIANSSQSWTMELIGSDASQVFRFKDATNSLAKLVIEPGGGTSNLLYLDSTGNVGIGTASPSTTVDIIGDFELTDTVTTTTGELYSMDLYGTYSPSGASDARYFLMFPRLEVTGSNNMTSSSITSPMNFQAIQSGTQTINRFGGIQGLVRQSGAGTITDAWAFYTQIRAENAGGTITNAAGLYIAAPVETGTITNSYGIYQAGTSDDNYFAGSVGIGTTSPGSLLEVRAAAGSAGTLTLSTSELTVVAADVLGQIDFQAPSESSGTDAILVGASIWAEAEAEFTASVNATSLVFATGSSEAAAAKVLIDSDGALGLKEMTTPTAKADWGKIYTKNDNKLYFQDGAGNEHEISVSTHTH